MMYPLTLNDPEVRLLIDGTKCSHRIPISPQPRLVQDFQGEGPGLLQHWSSGTWRFAVEGHYDALFDYGRECPLWVKETFGYATGNGMRLIYRADLGTNRWPPTVEVPAKGKGCWKPNSHMKVHQSRLKFWAKFRVEPLQNITLMQAMAAGFDDLEEFREYWDIKFASKKLGWSENPWVQVFEWPAGSAVQVLSAEGLSHELR